MALVARPGQRVALAVTASGLDAGCPWSVLLDGRTVGQFAERGDALRWVELLERAAGATW